MLLIVSCGIATSILEHIMLVLLAHHHLLSSSFVDESHLVTKAKSFRFSLMLLWIVQKVAELVPHGLRPTHLVVLVAVVVIEKVMLVLLVVKMVLS